MKRKRDRGFEQETAELNITSAIDVVFLLLIFFIIMMLQIDWPEKEVNVRAYLPKQEETGAIATPEVEERTTVQIDLKPGPGNQVRILFNGNERRGFSDLRNALKLLQTSAPDSRIILAVDREVAYRHVVRTLEICVAQYKFQDISFALPKKES